MSSPLLLTAAAIVVVCIIAPVAVIAFAVYGIVKEMEALEWP